MPTTDTIELPPSVHTKQQYKSFGPKPAKGWPSGSVIWAHIRYNDNCGNGHNSFAITGTIRDPRQKEPSACGCLHDEIAVAFPELAPLIKWHLCTSAGPMHYIANTVYHAEKGKLEFARSSAIWPDATDEQLTAPPEELKAELLERLPDLMVEFKAAVESLGFVY